MHRTIRFLVIVSLGLPALAARGEQGGLCVWTVDPHEKVFRDAKPPGEPGVVKLRAARNEYESGQIAFRADAALQGSRLELSPLEHVDGRGAIDGADFTWSFVGFIPIEKNTPAADRLWVREAPCEVPDPLLEERTLDVPPGAAQPVWLTVRVPKDAAPGTYRGEASVVAGELRASVPVELTLDPFTVPEERHLLITNWFSASRIARAHGVDLWSEPFWAVLGRYADAMAAHRQNVALTPWGLIDVTRQKDGKLAFDYTRFDRYVELFARAGVADRIEISHVGGGKSGWGSPVVLRGVTAMDRETGQRAELLPQEGLAPLLADLERHLQQRGWMAKSMIHVADEPSLGNLASWREASEFVHRAAPRLRRIDAIETIDFTGSLEVWVPKLTHFDRWRGAFEARRGDGEFWYYICCHPVGNFYPNRFMDLPGSRVRVLHWINFTEELAGYLHWGLNFWGEEPFGPPTTRYGPGDTHVVYPGKEGPLSSTRWEIQRESVEDFEYLHLLATKTAALKQRLGSRAAWVHPRRRAMELARRVVPSIAQTEQDPARIMAVRAQVAEEIVALDEGPLLLAETEPPAGATLYFGPITCEVRGVTEPGATVKVGGRPVAIAEDGSFACRARPSGESCEIRVEVQHDGEQKVAVRRFRVER